VTGYEYDNLNRLKKIDYLNTEVVGANSSPTSIQTATYSYDDLSRLHTATNDAGTVTINYDNLNRIKNTTDVFGHLLEYDYTFTSTENKRSLKFDNVAYADYKYDDADRLQKIVNSADSTEINFGYDNANRLTSRTYPNNVVTTYGYDNMSRLKQITDVGSSGTLFDRQYAYNNASQINQITEPAQSRSFFYDNVDRLTSMTNGTSNESYSYDDVGNRLSSHRSASYSYQPNQFNRLASTSTANYNYDANGNLTTKAEGKELWRFTWDYENRLTMASTRRQTVRYRYDALGRRVQRYIVGGKENTKFVYDGADVLVDDNNGTLTKYINGDGVDNKLRMQTGTDVQYFLADHLGSTNALTNSTGNVSSSASYDSFGNATGNLNTRYQYTGREVDNFTGLQYNRARWYDGNLGRFISEDPIGFGGGDINLFGYVSNNTLRYSDPSGLGGEDKIKGWAPEDFGKGWRGRIDKVPGTTTYEIHVYGPEINRISEYTQLKGVERGVVQGTQGWVTKHGLPAVRPPGVPDSVVNNINALNIIELRARGILPPKGQSGLDLGGPKRVNIKIKGYSYITGNLFGIMGGAICLVGLADGLLTDYETYSKAQANNRSFGEQFAVENENYKYVMTPLGLLPDPYYMSGIY